MVKVDKCDLCSKEGVVCYSILEDNGYTETNICEECLKQAIKEIQSGEVTQR